MENIEEKINIEDNKKSRDKYKGRYKEYQKEYALKYYYDNIQGKKKLCECGLTHDIFRTMAHLRTKKHQKLMNLKNEKEKNI